MQMVELFSGLSLAFLDRGEVGRRKERDRESWGKAGVIMPVSWGPKEHQFVTMCRAAYGSRNFSLRIVVNKIGKLSLP